MFTSETLFFLGFAVFVLFVMSLDLGVFSSKKARQSHVVSFKEAAIWSVIWVLLSLLFYLFLRQYGHFVHGIDDMARLQEVRDRYADHVQLTGSSFAENLSI
ncbi:MAG TPA: TerC family protein, partial [Fibrella sp.]